MGGAQSAPPHPLETAEGATLDRVKILFHRFEIEALAEAPDHCRRGTPASSVALQVQIDSIDPYLIFVTIITAAGCVRVCFLNCCDYYSVSYLGGALDNSPQLALGFLQTTAVSVGERRGRGKKIQLDRESGQIKSR